MTGLAVLLLILCYLAAAYLAWAWRTPIYLGALLAGHLSALASPLWQLLYGVAYRAEMPVVETALGGAIPRDVLVGAGWYYTLPAMVVLALFQARWWFPGALTALMTLVTFVLYHMLVESLGVRLGIWLYRSAELPFGLSNTLLSAVMAAAVSGGFLYVLLGVYRHSWPSILLAVLPAPLLLSLAVHGVLGAPLWAPLLLRAEGWAVSIGLACTLLLLASALQLITRGLSRIE